MRIAPAHGQYIFLRIMLLLVVHHLVLATESLYPAGSINQFLLAGKKRVATGADFHRQ